MLKVMLILLMVWLSSLIWAKKASAAAPELNVDNNSKSVNGADKNSHPPIIGALIDSISNALNCRIVVKEAKIKTTLNVRPTLKSVFANRENRKYIIRVNNNPHFKGIHHHQVPDTAKIGLWVHELMHIKDYQSRSSIGILKRGVQYMTKNGRRIYEHEIDRMVVTHGFGEPLYHWAKFIMFDSEACDSYKAYKQAVYLTPAQIRKEIGHRNIEQDN
jgi:hypothetical protein